MDGSTPVMPTAPGPRGSGWKVPAVIGGLVALVVGAGALLLHRAAASVNPIALAAAPKGVTVVEARATDYRPKRRYVATIEPWSRASVGPQLVAAYVDTVLVRPGAVVKRGDVLATLDCRNASAESQAVAMRARALEARQAALAKQASRVAGLLDGGFVAPNEVDQKQAEEASTAAQLLATRAQLAGSRLEVSDCVLRAPFDGEVAERLMDPGAFVRPGQAVVTVVDRAVVRVGANVPEGDFDAVHPGVEVRLRMLAVGLELKGAITRRAPSADAATRTIHVEIDVPDSERRIPVGTTAELKLDVGTPVPVVAVPLAAAQVRGAKASLFVVAEGAARLVTVAVKGESGGALLLDPAKLPAGAQVVLEGRSALADGDRVAAKLAPPPGENAAPVIVDAAATGAALTPKPQEAL